MAALTKAFHRDGSDSGVNVEKLNEFDRVIGSLGRSNIGRWEL